MEIYESIDKLSVLDKMCDIMRFVDPVHKKIINFNSCNHVSEVTINCFDFFGKRQSM